MPGIIKEVGQEVWVEGGPECETESIFNHAESCGGSGLSPKRIFRDGKMVRRKGEPCFHCEGTGMKPVSRWSDKDKAEWLKSWLLNYLRIHPVCPEGEWLWEIFNMKTRQSLAVDTNFSQALTAAVIEVARQGGKK